jgi:hypothetical protein
MALIQQQKSHSTLLSKNQFSVLFTDSVSRTHFHDIAMLKEERPLAERSNRIHRMRDEQHRGTALAIRPHTFRAFPTKGSIAYR